MSIRFLPIRIALLLALRTDAAPPNILFAIADDWGPHAGAYGTPWVKTPTFDRVAKDGLLFRRAYTPNAKCAPSRACILTGRNSWQLKEAAITSAIFRWNSKAGARRLRSMDGSSGTRRKAGARAWRTARMGSRG